MQALLAGLRDVLRHAGNYSCNGPKEAYERALTDQARYVSAEKAHPDSVHGDPTATDGQGSSSTAIPRQVRPALIRMEYLGSR